MSIKNETITNPKKEKKSELFFKPVAIGGLWYINRWLKRNRDGHKQHYYKNEILVEAVNKTLKGKFKKGITGWFIRTFFNVFINAIEQDNAYNVEIHKIFKTYYKLLKHYKVRGYK